jgi:uncharacterized protein (TIGR02145 family)
LTKFARENIGPGSPDKLTLKGYCRIKLIKMNRGIVWSSPLLIICLFIVTSSCKKKSVIENIPEATVTDIDGNVYHTVKIGTQVWMVENLNTTRYSNGDSIPEVTDAASWRKLTSGARCNHNNDPGFSVTYGSLYNLYAVNEGRKIAPQGWHVATDSEWTTLINYLGGLTLAGGKLKEEGTTHWPAPNTGATNISGFSALPGGYRDDLGEFNIIAGGYWWSSSLYDENDLNGAWSRGMSYGSAEVFRFDAGPTFGQCVRCVKD